MSTSNIIIDEFEFNGETIERGREFKVRGSNSKFTFLHLVVSSNGTWIEAVGSRKENRAFDLSAVSKVIPLPKHKRKQEA